MEGGGGGIASSSKRRQKKKKQLIFDRRYGWVYDEWRDPGEVALVGGRGMFCIVPLTKATVNLVFQRANITADSVVQVLENPSHLLLLQAWFKTAKERVGHNFQNWSNGRIPFRGKSSL
jgi:hypothetical protein